jgi:hypothetical protein
LCTFGIDIFHFLVCCTEKNLATLIWQATNFFYLEISSSNRTLPARRTSGSWVCNAIGHKSLFNI